VKFYTGIDWSDWTNCKWCSILDSLYKSQVVQIVEILFDKDNNWHGADKMISNSFDWCKSRLSHSSSVKIRNLMVHILIPNGCAEHKIRN